MDDHCLSRVICVTANSSRQFGIFETTTNTRTYDGMAIITNTNTHTRTHRPTQLHLHAASVFHFKWSSCCVAARALARVQQPSINCHSSTTGYLFHFLPFLTFVVYFNSLNIKMLVWLLQQRQQPAVPCYVKSSSNAMIAPLQ